METSEKFDIGIVNEEIKFADGVRDWESGSTYPCVEDVEWLTALLKAQAVRDALKHVGSLGDVTARQGRAIVAAASKQLEDRLFLATADFFEVVGASAKIAAGHNLTFAVPDMSPKGDSEDA